MSNLNTRMLRSSLFGTLALDTRIDQLTKAGSANFLTYLPLMYYRSMLNGKGKLNVVMNDRYPAIRPTTVHKYVARERL